MRLCGISSRFRLLSPCVGQVIHALLTRPPLSHRIFIPEENQIKCFVRLACVKHAASVHPEPGSNSHKISVLKFYCHFQLGENRKLAFLFDPGCKMIGRLTYNEEALLPSLSSIWQENFQTCCLHPIRTNWLSLPINPSDYC